MKGKYIIVSITVLVLSLGALVWSMGQEEDAQTLDEYLVGTVLLDENEMIDLKPGDTAVVVLEENPSTGYQWEIIVDPEGALVEVEKRSFQKGDKKLIGAPNTAVWKFSPKLEGKAKLTFNYLRPWEGEESIVETVVYRVRISE
ncbi:MAG: protease inhibitor I42 family protein [Deltaproteobacteria bacterium]|uniref:Protease inhibitor I42 family protein n=1 Tax=Candidatus Zymogenus saltonus TaxID=2844893 RepID=A0A9D8KKI3_9DELT|nr:protease inhibitor I42 family protein [Candidatus Zymogenus saltonus]